MLRFQFNKLVRVTHFIECKADICLYTLMTKLSNLTYYNLVDFQTKEKTAEKEPKANRNNICDLQQKAK